MKFQMELQRLRDLNNSGAIKTNNHGLPDRCMIDNMMHANDDVYSLSASLTASLLSPIRLSEHLQAQLLSERHNQSKASKVQSTIGSKVNGEKQQSKEQAKTILEALKAKNHQEPGQKNETMTLSKSMRASRRPSIVRPLFSKNSARLSSIPASNDCNQANHNKSYQPQRNSVKSHPFHAAANSLELSK